MERQALGGSDFFATRMDWTGRAWDSCGFAAIGVGARFEADCDGAD